jgi:hypothetical protein
MPTQIEWSAIALRPALTAIASAAIGNDLAGRDPRLFRAGVPAQAGRGARAVRQPLVQPEPDWHYHLFCSQFCGTEHAEMAGSVTVMGASEYQQWLAATATGGWNNSGSPP